MGAPFIFFPTRLFFSWLLQKNHPRYFSIAAFLIFFNHKKEGPGHAPGPYCM